MEFVDPAGRDRPKVHLPTRRGFIVEASAAVLGSGLLLGGLNSCGNSGSTGTTSNQGPVESAFTKLNSMSGQQRQKFLEQQAAKEGQVIMYSADDPVLLQVWTDAFNKQYPKVKAQFLRMSVPQVLQKATTEFQTKHPVADILHVDAESLATLKSMNALAAYKSPESKGFSPQNQDPKNVWSVEWLDQDVIGVNTSLVNKEDVPTTLQGLTDPTWKGKIGMPSVSGSDLIAAAEKLMGKRKGDDLMKKLAGQNVRLYASNTALGNALAAGQVQVGIVFLLEIASKLKAQGAPVDWVVPNPLLLSPYYQVIVKDAPHPYATALAYDWVISKAGQGYVKDDRIMGPRKDTAYPSFQVQSLQQAKQKKFDVISLDSKLLANPTPYETTYNQIFGNQ